MLEQSGIQFDEIDSIIGIPKPSSIDGQTRILDSLYKFLRTSLPPRMNWICSWRSCFEMNRNSSSNGFSPPYIKSFKFDFLITKLQKSLKLTSQNILDHDLVVISTDHDNINYELIYKNAKLILDTRGKYSSEDKKVIQAWYNNLI